MTEEQKPVAWYSSKGDQYSAYGAGRPFAKAFDTPLYAHPAPGAAAAQRIKEAHEQIVSLRAELRVYREREKTMGWNQS